MPTSPPPNTPPPGWFWDGYRWCPPQQQVVPQQRPGPHPTAWWHDGHKWRPPVGAQPSKWQLASQLPGMFIKLILLGFLLWLLLVFLFAH